MLLSAQIFSGSDEVMVLTERSTHYSYLIIAVLIFCLLLVSAARLRQRDVFSVLGQTTFFFQSISEQYKNGVRENPLTAVFLVAQYVIISGICIYWYNHFSLPDFNTWQTIMLIAFPAILLFYHLLIVSLAGTITGIREVIPEVNQLTLTMVQTAGIVVLAEFFFIYFQPEFIVQSKFIIAGTFLFFAVLRMIRGFYHVFQMGIAWYYIILYLWTLEILPLLIAVRLVFNSEISSWIG
ncbi:DUF4271 domain-containing protein [Fluviicola sp.]|jgi:hypothetical protein|uniref:DUF4271 domain-containing protein n=1 Tax=Fluviicola sp. TaxID=1917219 RepID=UPI00283321E2|nr:DUF4271 domain-containing protein [Fluviicola sp.]MDR0803137.1 DUF4271 domain-containing protein [Fluviicola sp.]